LKPIDPALVAAWRSGRFVVVEEPLDLVFGRLEAYVGQRIRLAPGIDPTSIISANVESPVSIRTVEQIARAVGGAIAFVGNRDIVVSPA
jgi:ferric-dicitrate binding protein FerR (iron transport regulator)